jgi:hypothetical protein
VSTVQPSRSLPVLALAVASALPSCGVSGVEQDATAVLLDAKLPRANAEGGASETRRDDILVGSEGEPEAPVHVEWTVAKDSTACLRVQSVKLVRTGGPTTFEIYNAKVKELSDGQCAGTDAPVMPGAQPDLADRVNVSYCWRWNGAANPADCAYSGGFVIHADRPKLEGPAKRAESK